MGTSISHPSPRNSNWKPVLACYTSTNIPYERIINEVWRATENDPTPISTLMKSETIFQCFNAVRNSKNYREALDRFNDFILSSKQNSIVAEFAKRGIPASFMSTSPSNQWKKNLFSEITNYVISRDASGFVGDKFRNKSIDELMEFKKTISERINNIISTGKEKISNLKQWNSFVDSSILKLKSTK
jgi:hypothetical protein